MKNLVAFLCMIFALVVTVFSFKCKACRCNNITCDEFEVQCNRDMCMTESTYHSSKGSSYQRLQKGCANPFACGSKRSDDRQSGIFRMSVKCCKGYLCNNDKYDYGTKWKYSLLLY
ncbi:uncharacterized protein ACNLHF_002797 isoform 2-T2 [Anomaloglossus baeobatrachus]